MTDMLKAGVYPASVTPFLESGEVDYISLIKLMGMFSACECSGVVLCGTTGEGPHLSNFEKRDIWKAAAPFADQLALIAGISNDALPDVYWLCEQAAKNGFTAVLVMPPKYFKGVSDNAVHDWFVSVMDASPIPVVVYNYPKMVGFELSAELLGRLSQHSHFGGVKDSSGSQANLNSYRAAVSSQFPLFVGNETLLLDALAAGWSGTISGAANVVAFHLSQIMKHAQQGNHEQAKLKFEWVLPVIEGVRELAQPANHKHALHMLEVLSSPNVRLPLTNATDESEADLLHAYLGIAPGTAWLPVVSR